LQQGDKLQEYGGRNKKLLEYHLWCRKNSPEDERFYATVDPKLLKPERKKPQLMPAAVPAMNAYNYVLTWADGNGGVHHGDLRWYMTHGEGALLAPEEQAIAWEGVELLIAQDRRLQAEEMKKALAK
jgi:hypothetical protein